MFERYDPIINKGVFSVAGVPIESEFWVCVVTGETWTTPEQMDAILDKYNEIKSKEKDEDASE
jgi:hypothetical protein